MYIKICIFNFKKQQQQQQQQTQKTRRQKAKETKEEKTISVENLTGHDDIVCEFALCTFNLLDRVVNFSWLLIWIYCSLCAARRSHSICYTTTKYEVHTFKNKNQEAISFSFLYICLFVCKFVIIETRSNDIAHDENSMSSSGRRSHWCSITKAVLKNFAIFICK